MTKEKFKQEVEKELREGDGTVGDRLALIELEVHGSSVEAIETAALMLGSDKSRGYCLEMICADFLAGANLENGNSQVLMQSMLRFFKFLPGEERKAFPDHFAQKAS